MHTELARQAQLERVRTSIKANIARKEQLWQERLVAKSYKSD